MGHMGQDQKKPEPGQGGRTETLKQEPLRKNVVDGQINEVRNTLPTPTKNEDSSARPPRKE